MRPLIVVAALASSVGSVRLRSTTGLEVDPAAGNVPRSAADQQLNSEIIEMAIKATTVQQIQDVR